MELSESSLRAMFVELRPVGTSWPYDRGSEEDIETHLRDIVASLQRSPRLVIDAHRDHYGSGYASYVHLFCSKRDGESSGRREGVQVPGIDLYLGRLAPLAVYGAGSQALHAGRAKSFSHLSVDRLGESPPGDWTWEVNEIRTKLERHGFEFPSPGELAAELPVKLKAKRYRPSYAPRSVFDAIFFWDE
jgi:hypothetical protein